MKLTRLILWLSTTFLVVVAGSFWGAGSGAGDSEVLTFLELKVRALFQLPSGSIKSIFCMWKNEELIPVWKKCENFLWLMLEGHSSSRGGTANTKMASKT